MERLVGAMALRDERGFTTAGMAVALLLTLALLFSAAQVYRVSSASAEVQEVADVAALAAESQVADFLWVVHKADATVLSMTLLAITLFGVGVVALCLPVADTVGTKLLDYAHKVMKARNEFAQRAADGLDKLQRALPFLAAAKAAAVAQANAGTGVAEAPYAAMALLMPSEGEPIEVPSADGLEGLAEQVDGQAADIKELSARAEEAAKKANEAKERGWKSDCGADPAHCQYERAASLAGLPEGENPMYRSVDAWSFDVALDRARAYYAARLAQEAPVSGSVKEQARSALRKRFYAYAQQQLAQGYVREDEGSFDARFPTLFRNTDQMRATPLYTEAAYPVTGAGGSATMHAWAGCPQAAGATRLGSLAELDGGGFATCSACEFTVASMGNVAAASTSIDNGFEHHYRAVAEAAADYQKARAELDPLTQAVKDRVSPILDACQGLLGSLGSMRIKAQPPGRHGAVALLANTQPVVASEGFESSFVQDVTTLWGQAAVSGATLLADEQRRGADVMAAWAEGLGRQDAGPGAAARVVMGAWNAMLYAYGDGQQALLSAVEDGLDGLPLLSESGLGAWAAGALEGAVEAVGLEPAEVDVLKPVTVNTAHIAQAGSDEISVRYASLKQRALSAPGSSADLFSSVVDGAERGAYDALDAAADGIVVAELELPVGGIKVPIRLALPPSVKSAAGGLVEQAAEALRGLVGRVWGIRTWR